MNKEAISKNLKHGIPVIFYDMTDSTNLRAREYIKSHRPDRAVIVANGQSAGRGRLGREFYSPLNTGIYMTYILRASGELCDAVRITTAAAVAVAEAIGNDARIKWVNDIYVGGKKVCGILTEAVKQDADLYIIIGIGINVTTEVFPDDIKSRAGSIGNRDKSELVADICDRLFDVETADYIDCYRERLLWCGQEIVYIENNDSIPATLVDVDDDGGLIVSDNGNKKTLRSGEITIREKVQHTSTNQ